MKEIVMLKNRVMQTTCKTQTTMQNSARAATTIFTYNFTKYSMILQISYQRTKQEICSKIIIENLTVHQMCSYTTWSIMWAYTLDCSSFSDIN